MVRSSYAAVIDRQLELFEEQAASIARERSRTFVADVDAVLALGLTIFRQIAKSELAAAQRQESRPVVDIDVAREIATVYHRWYRAAAPLQKVLKDSAAIVLSTDTADAFRDACRHARVPAMHFDDLLRLEPEVS